MRVATQNKNLWGERIYFYNCHRNEGEYSWYQNNLETSAQADPEKINASWTFEGKWHPKL